jgi:hypothetical protein
MIGTNRRRIRKRRRMRRIRLSLAMLDLVCMDLNRYISMRGKENTFALAPGVAKWLIKFAARINKHPFTSCGKRGVRYVQNHWK